MWSVGTPKVHPDIDIVACESSLEVCLGGCESNGNWIGCSERRQSLKHQYDKTNEIDPIRKKVQYFLSPLKNSDSSCLHPLLSFPSPIATTIKSALRYCWRTCAFASPFSNNQIINYQSKKRHQTNKGAISGHY
ncbi:hypothetical protein VNO77_10485 [Canavalia gladiata]|uniref:Uncharacterized protein n=1 Tax=Canavalia gladiata TaxID=3824 RepID=A0AAN9MAG5_CANGL